jgi:NTE family protein
MGDNQPNKRVALVIGAGSVKCAAALGLQKALRRENIAIDMVVGCSGGSLYAVLIALGYDIETAERMTLDLWTRDLTKRRDMRSLLRALLPGALRFDEQFGLIDDRLIVQRLRRAYGTRTFSETKIPLYLVATDFNTGEKVVMEEGMLVDAIRASIAIPFIFKPWSVNGRLLMDGFMADPLPVDVAIREGADIIISLGFESPSQRQISSVPRFAFQVTTIMSNNLLKANFAFHSCAHHTEIIFIAPQFEDRIGAFDTTRLPYIIEQGERAMTEHIPYLSRLLEAAV